LDLIGTTEVLPFPFVVEAGFSASREACLAFVVEAFSIICKAAVFATLIAAQLFSTEVYVFPSHKLAAEYERADPSD
jgi:hypothetical protein